MIESKKIYGWGRNKFADCTVYTPLNEEKLKKIVKNADYKSLIARGLGRSYGDSAQLDKKSVVSLSSFNSFQLDTDNHTVTAKAGISFDELLSFIVPKGFFLPVSPGTRFVTVGGAVASDVHGKNHHINGSFGQNLKEIILMDGTGEIHKLRPFDDLNPHNVKKFWATVGGMGLTGIILEATFSVIPISSSYIKVDTKRFLDIDSLMTAMVKADKKYKYSVAWVDSLNKNFRGVLSCGEHLDKSQLSKDLAEKPLDYGIKALATAPKFFPSGFLNKFTVKTFNEAWFRKHPKLRYGEIQSIGQFFYPLDGINNWNRIYGSEGFIQYQFVVPDKASYLISKTLEKLRKISAPSFLTVLKRFGKNNPGYLSFPIAGWTLAIDIPSNIKNLNQELSKLDKEIVSEGGRIYLAKDSRQSPEIFRESYQMLEDWLEIKRELDPYEIFMSDSFLRLLRI
tara:strand:- start:7973 stop:9331 length:1359 start_codon:yes stop_codon:yes gene_type:complete